VDLGFNGWGTGQSISMNIVSDSFNAAQQGAGSGSGKVTAYLFDNKVPNEELGADKIDFLKVWFKKTNGGSYYYLEANPGYIGCPATAVNCLAGNHSINMIVTPSGPNFQNVIKNNALNNLACDGTCADGNGKSIFPPALVSAAGGQGGQGWFEAKMVHMNPKNAPSTFTYPLPDGAGAGTSDVYIPLGRSRFNDPLSVDVAMFAWGAAHGYHIDILADQWVCNSAAQRNKMPPADVVTAYVKDNKGSGRDHTKFANVVFSCVPGIAGVAPAGVAYYLKTDPTYFKCPGTVGQPGYTNCNNGIDRNGRATVTISGLSANAPAGADGPAMVSSIDPQFATRQSQFYQTATLIDLGDRLSGSFSASTKLEPGTMAGDSPVWILLGASKYEEPFSVDVSVSGWGLTHGAKFDVVSDFIRPPTDNIFGVEPPQEGKVTVYMKDNKSPGDVTWHDPTEYYTVYYTQQKKTTPNGDRASGKGIYYLEIQPEALRCPSNTSSPGYPSCMSATHTISVSSRGMTSLTGDGDPNMNSVSWAPTATMKKSYGKATKISLSTSNTGSFTLPVFVDRSFQPEWVPIGSTGLSEPLSVDVTGRGPGIGTSLKIDIVSDNIPGGADLGDPETPPFVTAYIKDNKGGWRDTSRGAGEDDVKVMYRRYTPDQGPARVYYYLWLGSGFPNCNEVGEGTCADGNNAVMLTVTGSYTLALGNTANGMDPNRGARQYGEASKVVLSDVVRQADLADLIGAACLLSGNPARRDAEQVNCNELVNPAPAASTGGNSATVGIAVGVVVGVLVVAGAAFMYSKRATSAESRTTVSFDNPLYDTAEGDLSFKPSVETGTDEYAEGSFEEGGETGGYMDVSPSADGAQDSGGYMDVTAAEDNGDV
jgi:hypothetical protein